MTDESLSGCQSSRRSDNGVVILELNNAVALLHDGGVVTAVDADRAVKAGTQGADGTEIAQLRCVALDERIVALDFGELFGETGIKGFVGGSGKVGGKAGGEEDNGVDSVFHFYLSFF